MSARPEEQAPAGLPSGAKQAGETRTRWSWVEPSVWSERMLTALEEGVKGGKNAFFAEQGLFSFAAAHARIRQSSRR
jgi:hypothetical protein